MAEETKGHRAEGVLGTFVVADIKDNPFRPPEVFVWNEDKLVGLGQTYLIDGVQATFELTADKWDRVYLAGGGHHRMEALRRGIEAGDAEKIRGLFKNDKGEWCIKAVKKKYTKEQMMRNFMIENADAWNKDNQQNVTMMTIQIKDYLDRKLIESTDVDDFIESVKSPYPLKMNERTYTRSKNAGIGASTIVQYLGENTWSREAISMCLSLIGEDGPEGKKLREMAEKLPNVTMAYKFKHLMTQEVDGEKVLSSADDQEKAEKIIAKEALSRSDLEKADKLKKEQDLSPLAALNAVVTEKKEDKTSSKAKAADGKPQQKAVAAPEAALTALKTARNMVKLLKADDAKWSKAQMAQAKELLKDLATDMKEMDNGKKAKK